MPALLFAGTAAAQPTIAQGNFAASPGESFVVNTSAWMDLDAKAPMNITIYGGTGRIVKAPFLVSAKRNVQIDMNDVASVA